MIPIPKQPAWLRGLEIATGVLTLVLAAIVLAYPGLALATLIVLLSFGLIFLGVRSVGIFAHKHLPSGHRWLSLISGILSFFLAVFVLIFPGYALLTLIWLLSFGLLFYGIWIISVAYMRKTTSGGLKALSIVIGILDIILSVMVFVYPGLALASLVVLLGAAMLLSGIETIVSGVVGRTWLGEMMETVRKEMSSPSMTT